uniref:CAP10 domain-containing protein n=1 Tax=Haemonchus contortus TaxID=6289 RepID=A0A7I4Y5J0_HAECO
QQATNSCPYDIHAHFAGYRSRKFSCMILLKLRYGACGAQGMDLAAALVKCGSATTRILSRIYSPVTTSVQLASGRWYPQPDSCSSRQLFSTKMTTTNSDIVVSTSQGDIRLVKEDAAPVYYKPKGEGKTGFELVPWKDGEQIANYVLFEASMERSKVPWNVYDRMTRDERTIYLAHLKAVQQRKLKCKDPFTGYVVFTVSHHLYRGTCCGNGCRHCPYRHENASDDVKKSKVWNGAYYV